MQTLSHIMEERIYYRNQIKNTNKLFLQFSKQEELIYQNAIVPEEY